jgi:DNA mismatch endonuclease Vsr
VAQIQSFPDDFILTGSDVRQYRALGNAVCPTLMWRLMRTVIKAIKKTDKKMLSAAPFRTPEEIRSFNMSRIRSQDTSIELALRRALWAKGYRYVTHYKDATGKPDIAFKSTKLAVFLR